MNKRIFTIKPLPRDLMSIDVTPFVDWSLRANTPRRHQRIMETFRDELAKIGGKKNNVLLAKKAAGEKLLVLPTTVGTIARPLIEHIDGLSPKPQPTRKVEVVASSPTPRLDGVKTRLDKIDERLDTLIQDIATIADAFDITLSSTR